MTSFAETLFTHLEISKKDIRACIGHNKTDKV